jgi:hypothetical protein
VGQSSALEEVDTSPELRGMSQHLDISATEIR